MERFLRNVGKSIKYERQLADMSLPALAKKAGISKGNLSKIENHPCNVGLETLYKLSEALDMSARDFLP